MLPMYIKLQTNNKNKIVCPSHNPLLISCNTIWPGNPVGLGTQTEQTGQCLALPEGGRRAACGNPGGLRPKGAVGAGRGGHAPSFPRPQVMNSTKFNAHFLFRKLSSEVGGVGSKRFSLDCLTCGFYSVAS
jgi:hypothetical protein